MPNLNSSDLTMIGKHNHFFQQTPFWRKLEQVSCPSYSPPKYLTWNKTFYDMNLCQGCKLCKHVCCLRPRTCSSTANYHSALQWKPTLNGNGNKSHGATLSRFCFHESIAQLMANQQKMGTSLRDKTRFRFVELKGFPFVHRQTIPHPFGKELRNCLLSHDSLLIRVQPTAPQKIVERQWKACRDPFLWKVWFFWGVSQNLLGANSIPSGVSF